MAAETALTFYVSGRPVPQGSKSLGHAKDGRAFMRESGGAPLRAWRKAVRAAAVDAATIRFGRTTLRNEPMFDGPVAVTLTFALARPKAHGRRRTWPSTRPDVDKLTRAVLDAITGPIVADDGQVVSLTARKVWAEVDVDWPEGVHVWVNHAHGAGPVSALQSPTTTDTKDTAAP